jgi:hypothetical protein
MGDILKLVAFSKIRAGLTQPFISADGRPSYEK